MLQKEKGNKREKRQGMLGKCYRWKSEIRVRKRKNVMEEKVN